VNAKTQTDTHAVQTVDAEKIAVHLQVIRLIRGWSRQPEERWADLRSRARTQAAHELIAHIRSDLEKLEQQANGLGVRTACASSLATECPLPVKTVQRKIGDGGWRLSRGRRGLGAAFPSGAHLWLPSLLTKKLRSFAIYWRDGARNLMRLKKKKVLDQLISKEFVVLDDRGSPTKYKLTGKAQQLLAERGVGLSGG
jgi:hypothetical protein